jgi:hypothetical protein
MITLLPVPYPNTENGFPTDTDATITERSINEMWADSASTRICAKEGTVVKCYVPSKKCLLDAVCCVLCVLLFPNALQTSLYYYSASCPSAFQHIPEMLYHIPPPLIGKRSLLFTSGA